MGSMNLLGFSLSPQQHHEDHHPQNTASRFGFNPDGISAVDVPQGGDECFDLDPSSHHHSLNLPPPFGIYEAFNRNTNHLHHTTHQDWKENDYNSQNVLLGTSCNNQNVDINHQPKLENFLGRHSFGDHHHHEYNDGGGGNMFQNCSLQLPTEHQPEVVSGGSCGNATGTNSIGLSMIKTWLRNQPHHSENKENGGNNMSELAPLGTSTNNVQSLSLSMSTGSQSSSSLPLLVANNVVGGESSSSENNNNNKQQGSSSALDNSQSGAIENNVVPKKSIDTFGQRTSIYRGVTRHRWTGRYEAHLWDNSCRREGQTRKGRQVYLGGYDKEEKAARAYDLAALKYWGTTTTTNFPISQYEKELEDMKHMTRQEYVASLRRKSSGFSRGASIYRGVTRHHQHGRWQARIGRVAGNKDLYLGTFSTQEEAAEAYDIAAIKFRGLNAVTNFDMSRYDVKSILESSTLPIGGAAKRLKDIDQQVELINGVVDNNNNNGNRTTTEGLDHNHSTINTLQIDQGINNNNYGSIWPSTTTLAFQQHHMMMQLQYYPNYGSSSSSSQRLNWCKQEHVDPDDHHDHVPPNHNFQDQLQLGGGGTHNFFQPNSGLIMGMDSASSIENSNYGGDHGNGYGYVFPIGATNSNFDGSNQSQRGNFGENNEVKAIGNFEGVFGSSTSVDPYAHARNLYYQQQQPLDHNHGVKANPYDQGSNCNNGNWVPTAIPTLATRSSANVALCQGAPPFTLLHD